MGMSITMLFVNLYFCIHGIMNINEGLWVYILPLSITAVIVTIILMIKER